MKKKTPKQISPKLFRRPSARMWPTLLLCISFGMLGLAFVWAALYWLVFVAVVPVFIYFEQFTAHRSLKWTLFDFYCGGLAFSYVVLFWISQADLGRWVTIGGLYESLIRLVSLSLTAFVFACGFLVIGWCVYLLRHKSQLVFILVLPLVWGLSEIFRSYLFALFTYGPGASLEPNWNFGALGLAAINSPLSYASRMVGLYGLTVLVVLINGAIYLLIRRKVLQAAALLAIACTFSLLGHTVFAPLKTGKTLHVAAVHISDPDGSLIDPNSLSTNTGNYDVVVMPEYSEYFSNADYRAYTVSHFGPQATIITSRNDSLVPKHNQLVVYGAATNKLNVYDKQFIIPGGETLPYTALAYFKLTGHQDAAKNFHDTQQVLRGSNPLPIIRANNSVIGPSVCSSITMPFFGMMFRHQGAQILTNSASLVFLAHAPTYHVQERYLLRYQAISSGLPIVHASRTGTTLIIDGNGHTAAHSNNTGNTEIVTASLGL